jgi:hypothetical protein
MRHRRGDPRGMKAAAPGWPTAEIPLNKTEKRLPLT